MSRVCGLLQGVSSKDFINELGYLGCEEIVHRDNICLLQRPHSNLSEANLGTSNGVSGAQQAGSAPPAGLAIEESKEQEGAVRGRKTFSPTASLVLVHALCLLKLHNTPGCHSTHELLSDKNCRA